MVADRQSALGQFLLYQHGRLTTAEEAVEAIEGQGAGLLHVVVFIVQVEQNGHNVRVEVVGEVGTRRANPGSQFPEESEGRGPESGRLLLEARSNL